MKNQTQIERKSSRMRLRSQRHNSITSRELFEANASRLTDALQETESLLESTAALLGRAPRPKTIEGMQKLIRRQIKYLGTCVDWFVVTAQGQLTK